MNRISLDSQISAVAMAKNNAAKLHSNRAHSDLLKRQLEEAEATLRFVRAWQDTIRDAVNAVRKADAGG